MKDYDYSQSGAYFVTICTKNKKCMFGEISQGVIKLSELGQIVQECWVWLPHQYEYVQLDEWSVVPNHFHGIVIINDDGRGEVSSPLLETNEIKRRGGATPPLRKHTLGQIVAYFKYQTTKQINQIRGASKEGRVTLPLLWQRNYYEHVIRNEDDMDTIREYITNNPLKWVDDENNPINLKCTKSSVQGVTMQKGGIA